jgi:hypothetical protein
MDGRPGGDRSIDPAELLRGALEKIVFFECRVSQLESELKAAVQTAERARGDAAAAHRKAVGLEEALAVARGTRAEAERSAAELAERVRLLEAERERLLQGLQDQARLAGAPAAEGGAPGDQVDLAGFISELRAEIETLRAFKAGVEQAAPRPPTLARDASVGAIGGALAEAGRASLTARDAGALRARLTTESDRILFEEAIERLRAEDPAVRLRAVQRLEALGPKSAAPLLAAAVGREPEAEVKIALLAALARVEEPFAADLAAAALGDARAAVRAAALDAYGRLAKEAAEPRILAALGDASPIVRRRAALLLGFSRGTQADAALAAALRDADPGVARAAAAALAGRPSAEAQRALAGALEHRDVRVRRAAAETLRGWSGERVDGEAPDHERRFAARRIAERLAAMEPTELRRAVVGAAGRERPAALVVHAFGREAAGRRTLLASAARPAAKPAPVMARAAVAVVAAPAPRAAVAVVEQADEEAVLAELRGSLRGRSLEELSALLGAPASRLDGSLRALAARGAVVERGPRWYVG